MIARICAIFDYDWYLGKVGVERDSALSHFLTTGIDENQSPNPFFDAQWYLQSNPDVAQSGCVGIKHYLEFGEAEGRWPSRLLDPHWYASYNGLRAGDGRVLEHYNRLGSAEGLRPNPVFDPIHYVERNDDLPRDLRSGAIHYLYTGHTEQRSVSSDFDVIQYRERNPSVGQSDAVYHYLKSGTAAKHPPRVGALQTAQSTDSAAHEVRHFSAPGADFEDFNRAIFESGSPQAKVVAFYLPQFHAIPQNDEWWGAGFTEWRNVARASPRFVGHYQPRVPRDLGFYDLMSPGIMARQIDMAKAAGIHAFCFYYYVFGKQKILERPIENLLADRSLDMPFCLMWANENWTRRWDGQESEVLLEQSYTTADDDFLIDSLIPYFNDDRYLRVAGRPMFIIYRANLIPDLRARVDIWRKRFRDSSDHNPWILMAQSFYDRDPSIYGLDGAVEFPPHKVLDDLPTKPVKVLDPEFSGRVFSYADVVEASLSHKPPTYPLIKTAVPAWDNDARRQGMGTTIANATPAAYEGWLKRLVDYSRANKFAGESLVFVNAWNEWAEGAYLEPDVHFGSAYLNATARALVGTSGTAPVRHPMQVLLVGHDAHQHGAQMTLLNLGRTLTRRFGVEVTFLLLFDGHLLPAYQAAGKVHVIDPHSPVFGDLVSELQASGLAFAITNTAVTGVAVPHLKNKGFRVVSLIHEMPRLIREFNIEGAARSIAAQSDVVVFPANVVEAAFTSTIGAVQGVAHIRPQGLYAQIAIDPDSRGAVRREFGLSETSKIVLGIGYADLRKGIDLFLETARQAQKVDPDLVFLWIGKFERGASTWLFDREQDPDGTRNLRTLDFTSDIGRYLSAADAFYLTSREDPFPSTVLEALACGLPVVGFAGRTGSEDLIAGFGQLVPSYNIDEAIKALINQIETTSSAKAGDRKEVVAKQYVWEDYAFSLLEYLDPSLKRISVAVPNYNYARYLELRLGSIFEQNYPVYEVIVLDDRSTDDSMAVLERIKSSTGREFRIIENAENSKSIMKQWSKAATETSGEFLWMAEADDLARTDFLAGLSEKLSDRTVFAFSDSAQIDEQGHDLARSYHYYFRRFHGDAFRHDFAAEASDFARRYLMTSNIILNVSSVVFRRQPLETTLRTELESLQSFRFAGDWVVYLGLCRMGGDVQFVSLPLNTHRRHAGSATHVTSKQEHFDEINRVHDFSAKSFDADATSLEKQATYRSEIREQFGLNNKA